MPIKKALNRLRRSISKPETELISDLKNYTKRKFWNNLGSKLKSEDNKYLNLYNTCLQQIQISRDTSIIDHPENNDILNSVYETMICYGYDKDVKLFKRFLTNIFNCVKIY